jgi:tRNA/tmRNA/rRNA uracil-C5-methylase (TrmA/RlmC/RlmD family)
LEVTVEKIVPKGFGLAFAENLTVFVPLAAPGDKLNVRLDEVKGRTAFAEIESIIEPSAERTVPPCKYFGTCGGCDFQQFPYERQLSAKVEIIKDSLSRIGKIEMSDIPIIPSPKLLDYRTRALWRVDAAARKMGYYKRNSHDVVDVDHCPVLDPALDAALQRFRSEMDNGQFWSDKAVVEATVGTDGTVSVYSADLPEAVVDVTVNVGGERFTFDARTFFQANLSLADELVRIATDGAEGRIALDLYCGVGLFALPLARGFERVIGVESNERAVEYARLNADNAALTNVEFHAEAVGRYLYGLDVGEIDFALLDPPRAGTEKYVIQNLIKLSPREVAYVACDPSILARDLRRLIDGGYTVNSIVALDLFPQTHHVETVARLSRS